MYQHETTCQIDFNEIACTYWHMLLSWLSLTQPPIPNELLAFYLSAIDYWKLWDWTSPYTYVVYCCIAICCTFCYLLCATQKHFGLCSRKLIIVMVRRNNVTIIIHHQHNQKILFFYIFDESPSRWDYACKNYGRGNHRRYQSIIF